MGSRHGSSRGSWRLRWHEAKSQARRRLARRRRRRPGASHHERAGEMVDGAAPEAQVGGEEQRLLPLAAVCLYPMVACVLAPLPPERSQRHHAWLAAEAASDSTTPATVCRPHPKCALGVGWLARRVALAGRSERGFRAHPLLLSLELPPDQSRCESRSASVRRRATRAGRLTNSCSTLTMSSSIRFCMSIADSSLFRRYDFRRKDEDGSYGTLTTSSFAV